MLIRATMKKKHLPEDSPLYKNKKAIGFIYFNYIKSYIKDILEKYPNGIKSNYI